MNKNKCFTDYSQVSTEITPELIVEEENSTLNDDNSSSHTNILEVELKKAQSLLLHHEKMASLGAMAAGVAHELNNPLAWIISNFQIIEQKYLRNFKEFSDKIDEIIDTNSLDDALQIKEMLKESKRKQKLDFMLQDIGEMIFESKEGALKMRKIVEGIRVFARRDKDEIVKSNMVDIVESALLIATNQIKYVAYVEKDYHKTPEFSVVPARLTQLFLNLMVNASQAMKEKQNGDNHVMGKLSIIIKKDDTHAIVEIKDTGSGIKPENINMIFEPFYTTKGSHEGTGLGLHIANSIVKAHQGIIEIESEIGKGSTFRVKIPFVRMK